MFPESQLLPISALQHLLFCQRQAALIHVERLWVENRLTVEGRHLHRKAHEDRAGWRDGVWIERGLALRSLELGLAGVADVVEFHPPPGVSAGTPAWLAPRARPQPPAAERGGAHSALGDSAAASSRIDSQALRGWRVRPVEYKRGRPKRDDCDRVQICAQAICLEEMLDIEVPAGELFYGKQRRRTAVPFDARLRGVVRDAARRMRELIESGSTPLAQREPKCDACSLVQLCLPDAIARGQRAGRFVDRELLGNLGSTGPTTDMGAPLGLS